MNLKLDGAIADLGGREFTYEVPKPFGPDRGPATITITARPATSANVEFRAGLDKIMHQAKLSDLRAEKKFERTRDEDAYINDLERGAKEAKTTILALNYDHCIIEWSTTIQNNGADLEPTRENFIALSEFEHPVIQGVMKKIQRDLGDWEKFALEAKTAAREDEAKN